MKKNLFALLFVLCFGLPLLATEVAAKTAVVVRNITTETNVVGASQWKVEEWTCVNYTTSCGDSYSLCCDGCSAWVLVQVAWILDDYLCPTP